MLFVIAKMQLIKNVLSPNSAANIDTVLEISSVQMGYLFTNPFAHVPFYKLYK